MTEANRIIRVHSILVHSARCGLKKRCRTAFVLLLNGKYLPMPLISFRIVRNVAFYHAITYTTRPTVEALYD